MNPHRGRPKHCVSHRSLPNPPIHDKNSVRFFIQALAVRWGMRCKDKRHLFVAKLKQKTPESALPLGDKASHGNIPIQPIFTANLYQ